MNKFLSNLVILVLLCGCGPSKKELEEARLKESESEKKILELESKMSLLVKQQADAKKKAETALQKVRDEFYSIIHTMSTKTYSSPGLFYHSGSLLKRNGYDASLQKPVDDAKFYYTQVTSLLQANSEYLELPSFAKINELFEGWAKAKQLHIHGVASAQASGFGDDATIRSVKALQLQEANQNNDSLMKSFFEAATATIYSIKISE